MATVLSISSQVVRGAVGNSVAAFALQRMGHTVMQLPTVLLSNHPGHGTFAGDPAEPLQIKALWHAIRQHGWDRDVDAVLSGYMPTGAIVRAVAEIVGDLKRDRSDLLYLCDPAIGDEPKGLYVADDAAIAVRDLLLPHADITTPNLFELSWLSGTKCALSADEVGRAAETLKVPSVVTTSVPGAAEGEVANVLCRDGRIASCATSRLAGVPNGMGDLFGALFLAEVLNGKTHEHALGFATAALREVILASDGQDALDVVRSQDRWISAVRLPVAAMP